MDSPHGLTVWNRPVPLTYKSTCEPKIMLTLADFSWGLRSRPALAGKGGPNERKEEDRPS